MHTREIPSWTKKNPVICPDCGYTFGHYSIAKTLQIIISPGNPNRCKRAGPVGVPTCPRVSEAIAAANATV